MWRLKDDSGDIWPLKRNILGAIERSEKSSDREDYYDNRMVNCIKVLITGSYERGILWGRRRYNLDAREARVQVSDA